MRYGSVSVLALALCAAGCGKSESPAPQPMESPTEAVADMAAVDSIGATPSDPPTATAPVPPAAMTPAPEVPAKLSTLGTEPFWNARIDGSDLVYTTPEDQKGQHGRLTRIDKPGGAEFSGKLGASAIHLDVTRRTCSDGMSDRTYRFTVVLTIGSERRDGCAS